MNFFVFIGALLGFFMTSVFALAFISFFDAKDIFEVGAHELLSAALGTFIGGFVVFYLQYLVGLRKELQENANSYNEIVLSTHYKLTALEGFKDFMQESANLKYRLLHIIQPLDVKREPRAALGDLVRLDGKYKNGAVAMHFLSAEEVYISLMLKFEERARARQDLLASLENFVFDKSSESDVLKYGDLDALVRLYYHTEELLSDLDMSIARYRVALHSLNYLGEKVFGGSRLKLYSPVIKEGLQYFPPSPFVDKRNFRAHLVNLRVGLARL
ncbi:MAG TPA: hypothetical protein VL129_00965 [Pseudomonas sp.]|uniref:hypothetical protein n=1 Tax=Pseudomonas sp. TaxID=306 RepID=UPI002C841824|nr:hypothetical protein [Pseudomonas sp.]HTO17706.1 hypothetical protein [Pseudomonas sp.]